MTTNIPLTLKTRRKASGLSVREVLEKLREYDITVSDKTLYGWESGHRQPDADIFLLLCRIYGIDSLSEILEQENSKPFSDTAMRVAAAFDKADEKSRDIVLLTLAEYLPGEGKKKELSVG